MKSVWVLGAVAAAFVATPAAALDQAYAFTGSFGGGYPDATAYFSYSGSGDRFSAFSLDVGGVHYDASNVLVYDLGQGYFTAGTGNTYDEEGIVTAGFNQFDILLGYDFATNTFSALPGPEHFEYSGLGLGVIDSSSSSLSLVDAVPNSAVPEPATWGMMLIGFGAVGYGLRRKRAQVRVTYA